MDRKTVCVFLLLHTEKDCPQEQAQQLFHALRKLDDLNYKLVYAACPQSEGLSLAVYNRMIRAAGFEVQTLD
ncbi:MAG: Sua5 family C-terminal domain-containing protein [Acutalibacteraceae bacterium]